MIKVKKKFQKTNFSQLENTRDEKVTNSFSLIEI